MKKKWSGERLETYVYGYDTVDHLHRYSIALEFVKNKTVVDIACGEGYGSSILSKIANDVIGIDIDENTVSEAIEKYKNPNLTFLVGSTDMIPIDTESIDVVVSFETLEHHDKHHEMYSEIKRILKKDGILIISTPDKKNYSDIKNRVNPFHVKELYLSEFRELTSKYFRNVTIYFQKSINGNSTIGEENLFHNIKVFSGNYTSVFEHEVTPLYNIAIASDFELEQIGYSIFDGDEISQTISNNKIREIQLSTTFKLGKFLLFPLSKLKNSLNL
jgi:ubiquinone/menaquinone biosynthesis C-methylase UbiE